MADQRNTMNGEKIGRIEATLELLSENVQNIQLEIRTMNETLAVNTKQLEIHIEGVMLAREQNDILRKDLDSRLAPIQEHVIQVRTMLKVFAVVAGLPAFVYYIIMAISKIRELTGH